MGRPRKEQVVEEKNDKLKKREELFSKIERDFGKGTLIGANYVQSTYNVISTGSIGLNKAIGIGGLPKGRIVEILGPESSGKTTLTLEVIANAHKNPESLCAFVDAEHALDLNYAKALGIDINRLDISQPDYGEQALEIARRLIQSELYDVVVIDSVAALVPKTEIDGEVGDSKMAPQARMMGQALRMLTADVAKTDTCLIFVNQVRSNIGGYGPSEVTTGGNSLKFYASIRIDIRRIATNKDGDEAVSNRVRVKVIKNKVSTPFKQVEFNIEFGVGIDKLDELIDIAVDLGIINKAGSWFSYGEAKIGQGKEQVKNFLRENEKLHEEIYSKVMKNISKVEIKEISEEEKQKHTEDEN